MPQIRKLSTQEVAAINNKGKGKRQLAEEEYNTLLSEYAEGDYGEATLEPGEKRLTIRNRLKAAAKRRGVGITFQRTFGELVRFKIVPAGEMRDDDPPAAPGNAKPVSSDAPPSRRKSAK